MLIGEEARTAVETLRTDRGTLDGFRRGNRAVLEQVYRSHVDRVKILLYRGFVLDRQGGVRVTGIVEPEDLKEALQEVFVRAFAPGARERYDGLSPYRPYLLRIAKNHLIDRYRRRGRSLPSVSLDEVPDRPDEDDEAPEARVHDERLRQAVGRFLDGLEPPWRTLYELRYVEELSLLEVARQMGITRKRARVVEGQLRRQLAEFLERA